MTRRACAVAGGASLAITDELLSRSRERKAPLHELAERELQSFGDKVSIQGPPLDLGPDLATATVLALHSSDQLGGAGQQGSINRIAKLWRVLHLLFCSATKNSARRIISETV